jgi:hypothetical protein
VRVVLPSHEAVPQMPGSHHREAAPERREACGLGSSTVCPDASSHDNSLEHQRWLRQQQGTCPRAREDRALLRGAAVAHTAARHGVACSVPDLHGSPSRYTASALRPHSLPAMLPQHVLRPPGCRVPVLPEAYQRSCQHVHRLI